MPTTAPPDGRINNTAVYDSGSERLIIFGGITSATCCTVANDVWVLTNAAGHGGPRTWINLVLANAPGAPPPTAAASAVYDPGTNRMIVFGGQVNHASSSQLWILDHANGLGGTPSWIHVIPANIPPPARQNHQAVYDPATNRMIVFGGLQNLPNSPIRLLNDVWVLQNANGTETPVWKRLSAGENGDDNGGNAPSPRHSMAAAYDSAHNRWLIFGGCTDADFGCNSTSTELWALSNANGVGAASWQSLSYTGTPPAAHAQYASTAYVASSNKWIGIGGRVGSQPPYGAFDNETWVLLNANGLGESQPQWTTLTPGRSPASRGQSVSPDLYDRVARRFIVFGGPGLNDTWTLLFR